MINETYHAELLLVEDGPQDLELTLRALRKIDVPTEVKVARDGLEALEYLFSDERHATRPPMVILLDLKLPKIDGLEVLKRLKSDSRTATIPIVVLTSSKEQSDVLQSYSLGANCYIVKPVKSETFIGAVRDLGTYWLLHNQFLRSPT